MNDPKATSQKLLTERLWPLVATVHEDKATPENWVLAIHTNCLVPVLYLIYRQGTYYGLDGPPSMVPATRYHVGNQQPSHSMELYQGMYLGMYPVYHMSRVAGSLSAPCQQKGTVPVLHLV